MKASVMSLENYLDIDIQINLIHFLFAMYQTLSYFPQHDSKLERSVVGKSRMRGIVEITKIYRDFPCAWYCACSI